jgi:hypothetical protein
MSALSVAARVAFGVVAVVGVVSTGVLVHKLFVPKTSWNQPRQTYKDWWREPSAWPGFAAFGVLAYVLSSGLDELLKAIFGFSPGYDSEGEWVSVGSTVGVALAVAAVIGYVKLRDSSTQYADLSFELAVRERITHFRVLRGTAWESSFEQLKAELQEAEKYPELDAEKREVLEEAVSRAEAESRRREETARRQASRDVRSDAELSKLVGRRVSSVAMGHEGFLQLEFADGSCFAVPSGTPFVSGKHYDTVLAAAVATVNQHGGSPSLGTLRTVDGVPSMKAFNAELRSLFITLWDKAGTSNYDKAEWKRFGDMLSRLGIPL